MKFLHLFSQGHRRPWTIRNRTGILPADHQLAIQNLQSWLRHDKLHFHCRYRCCGWLDVLFVSLAPCLLLPRLCKSLATVQTKTSPRSWMRLALAPQIDTVVSPFDILLGASQAPVLFRSPCDADFHWSCFDLCEILSNVDHWYCCA